MDSVCEKLNNKKVYYTPKNISEMLKVSYRTILDLIHMGKLSAIRVGNFTSFQNAAIQTAPPQLLILI